MKEHSLDTYLKSYCSEYPDYMNLYSTWNLNKTACSDALKNVVIHYPHFSMHDSSHADTVLSKIEMLLGDRIQQLSPTDTWLILHAAYTHDLGMVIKWEEIERVWSTSEFQDYLSSLSSTSDRDLQDAITWVRDLKASKQTPLWPLKTYRYVNLLNASFFRQQHAQLSRRYLDLFGSGLKIDLGHSGLIRPRLLKLLGRICELHTAPVHDVLTLDYETDGFGSDYAHPRFVAMLLRLGDLLDVDNGRFNTVSELASGQLPESSIPHKEKHSATTHLLVTPSEIQFTSDCPNTQAYLEARNFVDWLESEIDFLTKYWVKIVPTVFDGFAPRFDKKELYIAGTPDIEGVAGLRFEISQKKAFQIIEGSNIYQDRFVFIREVLQNSMDASKLQLWQDLCSGTYDAWTGNLDLLHLQPHDIDPMIYRNYPICVSLSTLPDGVTQVVVKDRGTGISVESFKRMCNVGSSNAGSEKLRQEIEKMPSWLRPTAGFGVGLQSIFLVTDEFEIDTSTGLESFHAVVHSNRRGGYLQLQRVEKQPTRGTTICITFHTPEQFQYSWSGDTQKYLWSHFDPITGENCMCEARVLEAIRNHCQKSMFPIHVHCSEPSLTDLDIIDTIPICAKIETSSQNWVKSGQYQYFMAEDCSRIKIWDTETATYGEFYLSLNSHNSLRLLFKGVEIEKHHLTFPRACISGVIDLYGLDTKETISLNRSSLTAKGSKQARQIIHALSDFYIDCVLIRLCSGDIAPILGSDSFHLYAFWRACDPERQAKIPESLLKSHITQKTVVIKRNDHGAYTKDVADIGTLIPFSPDTYFLNIREFSAFRPDFEPNYEELISALKQVPSLQARQIVVADDLIQAASALWLKTVEFLSPSNQLLLYSVSPQERPLLSVKDNARNEILRGLSQTIRGFYESSFNDMPAKRYAIPALEGYESLYLERIPYGITAPKLCRSYYIIAPFDREQALKSKEMSEDAFVNAISESPGFSSVVSYVLEHSPQDMQRTQEDVISAYKSLISEYHACVNLKKPD